MQKETGRNENKKRRERTYDIKGVSIIKLITNYKTKGLFEARLVEDGPEDKRYVYIKVGEEEFYVDLEENEVFAKLFSHGEMADVIETLMIEKIRLETNLALVSKYLSSEEFGLLNFSSKGFRNSELMKKLDIDQSTLEMIKQAILFKLDREDFTELLNDLRYNTKNGW
jgi:hypothetical protein